MRFPIITTRLIDAIIASISLAILGPFLVATLLVSRFFRLNCFFVQERVGSNGKSFRLIKFRTMRINTESVATHLARESDVTPLGKILRRSKIDEIPQLYNVLVGDMSLVGPRPSLPNQEKLVEARRQRGVLKARPGITGLAQVRGIDMSEPTRLARVDALMIRRFSICAYVYFIVRTLLGGGQGDKIQ